MSDTGATAATLSPLKRALVAIETLQARLDEIERARTEPIAIVGVGCRLPGGANSPDEFWTRLRDGVDLISEVPADRWDADAYHDPEQATPGTMSSRDGGFLDQVDRFDPGFFGLSLGEAASMDPQQRLLLEVAWEALEHAGQVPAKLAGTHTDVYVGISTWDYSLLLGGAPIRGLSGTAFSIAANRLSYVFDLHGASLAVDTACSSSLVAVHLACQSLRAGTARTALAGGVNVMLWPETTAAFSQVGMLSPDGRSRTFDASANGYVRGEGAGMVVLKRLSDARADGDRVLAVIRGSAVNQDGHSNGLTAPNSVAQEAVLRAALADARIAPHRVDYVEAHGTGTTLGDPIEVRALAAALGPGRDPDHPLLLGSVKTNTGHLEAAAGITGLIKVALGLHHGEIPPHLHLRELNPHVEWDKLPLRVTTTRTAWPSPAGKRVAGVSSFGFGGTNAHIVLGDAPTDPAPTAPADQRPLRLLTVSGRSEEALRDQARRYADRLAASPTPTLAGLCHTTNARRTHFAHRAAVPVADLTAARAALTALAAGDTPDGLYRAAVPTGTRRRLAFVFPGQGGQHIDMGRELYRTEPVFRRTIDRIAELFDVHHPWRLRDVMYPAEGGVRYPIDETEYAQPTLFAIQCALAETWRSWGVRPDAVMGHSLGEYAAAWVAGVFSLETGVRLIVERGRLTQTLPPTGMMAACSASAEDVAALLDGYAGQVAIAAINGPEHTVISGEKTAVQAVLERLEEDFVLTRPLRVSYASHSPLLEPILDEFEKAITGQDFGEPQIPFMSTYRATMLRSGVCHDPAYWRQQLREPVRFLEATRALAAEGYDTFLEMGPKDTLIEMGKRCLPRGTGRWLRSLDPETGNWQTLLDSAAGLHTHGVDFDWDAFEGAAHPPVDLPTYPFQRRRCWLDPEQIRAHRLTTEDQR
ncbi:Acyl transferase domain-containing protein [Micromonospora pallida]|uniref:Acyl transferase domain-containing protein n=1 Tax=Micromonospora pallida TaxID=145854 RepID=A0A1C6S181_9ACTN|nr:type I polyketide synthase [Micromonospora pallida]SCL23212.1 Acyl transferase domain-containing protein [Micromonospora pallida]